MNTPLYGDSLEINDDECYSDDEETDIAPKIRLPEGNAAINAVARIMDGYGTDIPEHLLSEFVKMQIETRDLSALTDKDLELFGFKDERVRAVMIQSFAQLPNQNEHIGSESLAGTRKNYNLMLHNIADHLKNMSFCLNSVLLHTINHHTEDILIDETTYSSSVALRTVEEMTKTAIRLEEKLSQFAGQDKVKRAKNVFSWRNLFLFGAISAGSAYAVMKANVWGR